MILSTEQKEEFERVTEPVIKFLAETFHHHVTIVIESDRAEILESSAMIINDSFIL